MEAGDIMVGPAAPPSRSYSTTSSDSNVTTASAQDLAPDKSVKSKGKRGRSRPVYFWSVDDVNKWLSKHGGEYHQLYGELLRQHEVNGRCLARLTDWKLQRIGIENSKHREELMRHILRLKLKTDSIELKTLDSKTAVVDKKKS